MNELIPHDAHASQYQAWFTETIALLMEVLDYTETISTIEDISRSEIIDAVRVMREHTSLLKTEADLLQLIFQDMKAFVNKVQYQRDEAVAERDVLRERVRDLIRVAHHYKEEM